MVGPFASVHRFIRAWMPVVLALHLVLAQTVMLPPAAPHTMQAATAVAEPQDAGMHCHEAASRPPVAAAPAKPVPAHPAGHCAPGQCHCPVAMAQELRVSAAPVAFIRRIEPVAEVPGVPSLRQAPDLRPPIAS